MPIAAIDSESIVKYNATTYDIQEIIMYREIMTPKTQEITLKIPADYLNRRVEILVFEVNEGIVPSAGNEQVNQLPETELERQIAMAKVLMDENTEVLSKLAQ